MGRIGAHVPSAQLDSERDEREGFRTDREFVTLERRHSGRRSGVLARGTGASESIGSRRPGADLSSLQPPARFPPRSPKIGGQLRAKPNLVDV